MRKAASRSHLELNRKSGATANIARGRGIEVAFDAGKFVIRAEHVISGGGERPTDGKAVGALRTGDIVTDGYNESWIYCEAAMNEPFLVAPRDSGVMRWRAAMAHAARNRAELPDQEQLQAMYDARNALAFRGSFDTTGSFPDGWYWSATQHRNGYAWCQRFTDGQSYFDGKSFGLSVRLVRRYEIR